MGRTEFTRTITATTIKASVVSIKDGAIITTPCDHFTVNGNVDEGKAVDLAKKQYGKKNQYVVEIEQVNTTYAISVEDFMKYAHKVEPKPESTPEGNTVEQEEIPMTNNASYCDKCEHKIVCEDRDRIVAFDGLAKNFEAQAESTAQKITIINVNYSCPNKKTILQRKGAERRGIIMNKNDLKKKALELTERKSLLPFMEGREKADMSDIMGEKCTITDYGFLEDNDDKHPYACFIIKESKDAFFFGGKVLTAHLQEFEKEGYHDEIVKNGLPVKFTDQKAKKSKKNYTAVEFYPE